MSPKASEIRLNNGYKIPGLGLGTWQGTNDPTEVENAVKIAIDEGYRLFDCATVYCNELQVGKAISQKIREGVISRKDIFVITKLWNDEHKEEQVLTACRRSLRELGLDYVDLYLIHWPFSDSKDIDYLETWRGMEECNKLKLARSIGVSNFNSLQLTKLLECAVVKPVVNQIEVHICLSQKKLRDFCEKNSITVIAYSPFGAPARCSQFQPPGPDIDLNVAEITTIAKKYSKTNAQVALRYLIDIGTIPIPKSNSRNHIKENIDVFDFKLTSDEISTLYKLDTGFRTCTAIRYKEDKHYPFNIEF